jgi:type III pantothenate kinase
MKAYYLDIGNTSLKLAEPTEHGWNVLLHQRHAKHFDKFPAMLREGEAEGFGTIYLSSVRKDITKKVKDAVPTLAIHELSTSQIPERMMNYSTIQTLGMDRFLACLGAHHFINKSVIVIDTGSACTVDFMDGSGIYQGGVIMPGIEIIEKSMKRYLPELPDVQAKIPCQWPGKSTQASIQWGVYGSFKAAIETWVQKYHRMDGHADIFITGGSSTKIKQLLMPETELVYKPDLHFDGMKIFVEEILN